jgi:UDP-GlcNAc:undecaprenyl-phosphate GlcNAc-1-phosphate transferase
MIVLCLMLVLAGVCVSLPGTLVARALGRRLNALDAPGVPGQIKADARPGIPRVPNTGGVAVFLGIALPMLIGLAIVHFDLHTLAGGWFPDLSAHVAGLKDQTAPALALLAGLLAMHVLGLIDDRRALSPLPKLAVMVVAALGVVIWTRSGLLTMLDAPSGLPISVVLGVVWIVVITNAMNFLDNMDGLSAGVAAIAAGLFLWATLSHDRPQWFVAACLALLIGSCLGFLVFNFPGPGARRATIYMGDSGSLVLGFLLGFLTMRTTYYGPEVPAGAWYAVLMPVLVLGVPLYDLASVVLIRLRQGRSPMLGDTQHLSHRFERRGMSRRDSVLIIYGLTGITGIAGVMLTIAPRPLAGLIALQVLLVALVLALFEGRSAPATDPRLTSGRAPNAQPGASTPSAKADQS